MIWVSMPIGAMPAESFLWPRVYRMSSTRLVPTRTPASLATQLADVYERASLKTIAKALRAFAERKPALCR